MRQRSVDEGNEFGLVIGTGLSEDLLKLTTCRGYSYTYRPGSHLQPLPLRNRRDQKVRTCPAGGGETVQPTILSDECENAGETRMPQDTFLEDIQGNSRSREAASSLMDDETILRLGRNLFFQPTKRGRNRHLLSIASIKQRGLIMWDTIVGLFYRQACKASHYAIRSTL